MPFIFKPVSHSTVRHHIQYEWKNKVVNQSPTNLKKGFLKKKYIYIICIQSISTKTKLYQTADVSSIWATRAPQYHGRDDSETPTCWREGGRGAQLTAEVMNPGSRDMSRSFEISHRHNTWNEYVLNWREPPFVPSVRLFFSSPND